MLKWKHRGGRNFPVIVQPEFYALRQIVARKKDYCVATKVACLEAEEFQGKEEKGMVHILRLMFVEVCLRVSHRARLSITEGEIPS